MYCLQSEKYIRILLVGNGSLDWVSMVSYLLKAVLFILLLLIIVYNLKRSKIKFTEQGIFREVF